MRYLKVLKNLLFSISENNEIETIYFAEELCKLVTNKVQIAGYEADVAYELFTELDMELRDMGEGETE